MHTLEPLCLCTWKLCLFSPAAVHASSVLHIGPKSNFLRFSPSFLSEKSEVICKTRPLSTHTGPRSCFLWWLWIRLKHKHLQAHTCSGISERLQKNIEATRRIVTFLQSCCFLSCWEDASLHLMCSLTCLLLHQREFVCVEGVWSWSQF